MFEHYDFFLIVDLESTCCNDNSIPKGEGEIIEIGAVIVDACSLDVIDEFTSFIKPINYPVLTHFCSELTTITQNNVDCAPSFPVAIEAFYLWLNAYQNSVFCSWGNYDRNHLVSSCQAYQVNNPLEEHEHINLKKAFARAQKVKPMGMKWALELAGIRLIGTHCIFSCIAIT